MSLDSLDAVLSGGGAKSAFSKETPIGTSVTGVITDVSIQQITDYMTGKPKFWDGDRPQMQIVVIVQTDLREDGEDDGKRGIYIKTWGVWKENLLAAVKAAGFSKVSDALVPGATFTDTFSSTKPSTQGSDTKVHTYKIVPPAAAGLDDAMGADMNTGELPPQAPATPAPAAPVAAAPAPAAAPAAPPANDPVTTARSLIAANLPDDVIHSTTGLDHAVIQALRNAA